jgi:hypothetical protein
VLLLLQVPTTPKPAGHAAPDGHHTSSSRPSTPNAAAAAAAAVTAANDCSFAPPGTRMLNPQLQAQVLHTIAAMLSQPGILSSMLGACPGLPRLLLHMFAAAPSPAQTSAVPVAAHVSSSATTDTAAAAGAAPLETPSTGTGKAVSGPAVAAASQAGGKSATATPRGSLAVNVKGSAAAGQQAGAAAASQLSSSGAATPRKPAGPAAGTPANKVSRCAACCPECVIALGAVFLQCFSTPASSVFFGCAALMSQSC